MTGFWLVSYIGLWVIVILLVLLVVGLLQQLGLLQRQFGQLGTEQTQSLASPPPPAEQDGPALGSLLPDLNVESVNGFGNLTLRENTQMLVLFMSPMCEGCQKIVDSVNELIESQIYRGRVVVILRGDDHARQAFLKVFPLRVAVIQDRDSRITKSFAVQHSPFGLLYDTAGSLIRKGVIVRNEDLLTLLGEVTQLSKEAPTR